MTAPLESAGRSEDAVPFAFGDGLASRVTVLDGEWEFAELPAGRELDGTGLASLVWRPATVPGTVAGALRALGELDEERGNGLDERAFVYRRMFRQETLPGNASLVFDGLATLADAWLNGAHVLAARNMFRRRAVEVGALLRPANVLLLHFRALAPELARPRSRGRWRTRLVNHRQLRYVRSTLLGRMPGWAPPHPPVGPWRGIRLVENGPIRFSRVSISPRLDGPDGVLVVAMQGRAAVGDPPTMLEVRIAGRSVAVPVVPGAEGFEAVAEIRLANVTPWWSHDLGTPHRYPASLALRFGGGLVELGALQVGFRSIDRHGGDDEGFDLRLNGRAIFCRGACWTPADAVGFRDDPAEMRRVLGLARDAGMNMLRLSGTMHYESEAFYDACDELGILVWQDFMFASMDYPEQDAAFAQEVREEADQVLARLQHHPCIAVLCGNSEVEQQAAMMGLAPDAGKTPLFHGALEQASRRWCPGVPYVSSSPTGGALPFHVDAGIAHYFGVGAYLRPPADARESRVRFASECLAFSNVPEDAALRELFGEEARVAHSPRYRRGVPRDAGAGWDFGDVTDHYLERMFGCDVRALRYSEPERYLALARVVPGELMEHALGVWRASDSVCRGALVWFLRDLRPGSGWGVLDSAGRPKAPYWFLKRACAPRALWFIDEGLNGLKIHLRNDPLEPFHGRLILRLVQGNGAEVGRAETEVRLEGHDGQTLGVDALLGRFSDSTYAYRFGPCPHAIAVAELVDARGGTIASCSHLPGGLSHEIQDDIEMHAVARPRGDGSYDLRVESRQLALFVRLSMEGFLPTDNYFHLSPGGAKDVVLCNLGSSPLVRGEVSALNARSPAVLEILGLPG